jgi:hypothetical protein
MLQRFLDPSTLASISGLDLVAKTVRGVGVYSPQRRRDAEKTMNGRSKPESAERGGKRVGLLINFNEPILTKGLKRLVNHFLEPAKAPVTSAPSGFSAFDFVLLTQRLSVSAVKWSSFLPVT